ncbi:MAG: hypothetical protein ABIG44_12550 [Planctomycetota bacterium]
MKALTYALALIALAAVTPGMAGIFTWTGDALDDNWTSGDNWSSLLCSGPSCYPQTTSHDAVITGGVENLNLADDDQDIDSLTIQDDLYVTGQGATLTVTEIIIAGGTSATSEVEVYYVTIQTN